MIVSSTLNVCVNVDFIFVIHFRMTDTVFNRFPENWFGLWEKIGHDYGQFYWADLLNCDSCKYEARNTPVRLYSVRGVNDRNPIFNWKVNECSNTVGKCWGPWHRYWQVSSGYTYNEFVFKNFKSPSSSESSLTFMDELRVKVAQGKGSCRLVYTGIGVGRQCRVFLPLYDSPSATPVRMVLVKMKSREAPPANKTILEKLEYVYPNHISMHIYEDLLHRKRGFKEKMTEEELETSWEEIGYVF